jgi:hypothetical protein
MKKTKIKTQVKKEKQKFSDPEPNYIQMLKQHFRPGLENLIHSFNLDEEHPYPKEWLEAFEKYKSDTAKYRKEFNEVDEKYHKEIHEVHLNIQNSFGEEPSPELKEWLEFSKKHESEKTDEK